MTALYGARVTGVLRFGDVWVPFSWLEAVAEAADTDDVVGLAGVGLELAAELDYVGVDDAVGDEDIAPPGSVAPPPFA
jgi:hypothetical protein